jgi:hypothetical protein
VDAYLALKEYSLRGVNNISDLYDNQPYDISKKAEFL